MTDRDPIADILGRVDRPVMPSAVFARDLRDRLLAVFDPNRDAEGDHSTMTTITSFPVAGRTSAAPVPRRRPTGRWMPRLEAAAAILVLFGLFAALGGAEQLRDRFAAIVSRDNQATSGPLGAAAMYGGDAGRTGQQPGPEPAYEFVDSWQLGADGGYVGGFAPVALGDSVYRAVMMTAASDPGGPSTTWLQAVDVTTGAVRWQKEIDVWGAPAVTADLVYVNAMADRATAKPGATPSAVLLALDARTGETVWSLETGQAERWIGELSPIVLDDTVYATIPNGTVFAVDGRTGNVRWTSTAGAAPEASGTSRLPIANSGQLAAGDGAIFVVNSGGHVVAIDAASGNLRWDIDVRQRFAIWPERVDPLVSGGTVVLKIRGTDESLGATSTDAAADLIAAVDTATGQDLWQRNLGALSNQPAVTGGLLVAPLYGDTSGAVRGIDLQTGADAWTVADTDPNPGGVSVAGQTVFLTGGEGRVVAIDAASGQVRWFIPTGTKLEFAAVVTEEHLIVEGADGTLLSYSTDVMATPPGGATPGKATPVAGLESATAVAIRPSATPAP